MIMGSPGCKPPWSSRRLARKVAEAARVGRMPVGSPGRQAARAEVRVRRDQGTTWNGKRREPIREDPGASRRRRRHARHDGSAQRGASRDRASRPEPAIRIDVDQVARLGRAALDGRRHRRRDAVRDGHDEAFSRRRSRSRRRRGASSPRAEAAVSEDDEQSKRRAIVARRKVAAAERLFQWAVSSQNAGKLQSMLTVAKSFSTAATHHDQLDKDVWLFNTQNGTIDLRTGCYASTAVKTPHHPHRSGRVRPRRDVPNVARVSQPGHGRRRGARGVPPEVGRVLADRLRPRADPRLLPRSREERQVGLHRTLHDLFGDYACQAPRQLLFQSKERPASDRAVRAPRPTSRRLPRIDQGQAFGKRS